MEIVLLLIILVLIIIFQTGMASRIDRVENQLKKFRYGDMASESRKIKETEERRSWEEPIKEEPKTEPPAGSVRHFSYPLEEVPEEEDEKHQEELREPEQSVLQTIPETDTFEKEEPVTESELEKLAEAEKPEEVIHPKSAAYSGPAGSQEPEETWYTKFRKNNPDLEKFIGENLLSKIAISILVLGVAFFVKYAIDKNWINEVARVGIGILCGLIVLSFGHRLRVRFKAFSSVLVGGAIAIFYFSIGIGFHQYKIFDQTTAFVIMFVITSFSVFLSVVYDRLELAALSLIGGFATPFMVSTGEGNFRVLFTYLIILDVGMLVLAYLRKWNLINILSYAFTMIIYMSWLETKLLGDPRGPYQEALMFGAIFYVIFICMNIVNNIKAKRNFETISISILLSNTFLYYCAGMQVLHSFRPESKGIFNVMMALFNMLCAWLLHKQFKADKKLVYMMIGLTLTFITIAAPVQLEGNHITLFWAMESLLLMWLAQRSEIPLYRFVSVFVFFLMTMSLGMDWVTVYRGYAEDAETLRVVFNKGFGTGIFCAAATYLTLLLLKKEIKDSGDPERTITYLGLPFHAKNYSNLMRLAFTALVYFTGIFELVYQLRERLDESVAFYIVVYAYHLSFVCVFNFFVRKYRHQYVEMTAFVINLVSVLAFIIGFAILPIFDFKENIVRVSSSYLGIGLHYISLAAAVWLSVVVFDALRSKRTLTREDGFLPTFGLVAVVCYVLSVELLLHVCWITMSNVASTEYHNMISKLNEYETLRRHVMKIGFPVLWGGIAFGFLLIGMKRSIKNFRVAALVLIGVVLLKLFIYDINNTSEAGKIVSFILLGIVLLIISFMYQKIKALLLDDPERKNNDDKG
jgi:uncharacterized membrane protein